MAFDELTGRPAAPAVMCDIYLHVDDEFLLSESVLNNHSIAASYYRGDRLYLHIWSATDDRVCEQFKTFTVPDHNPYDGAESFDIETQIVRQPATWNITSLANQSAYLGSSAGLTFIVWNTEDDTGYSRSYDFLHHIERCPYFVITLNTTSVYNDQTRWSWFQYQDTTVFFIPVMDSDLTRDKLADGSRHPFGFLVVYLDAWFVKSGPYQIQYGLILDADAQHFKETGSWGDAAREISATAIITMEG